MIAAALALAALPVQTPAVPTDPSPGPVPGLLWADLDADGDLDALAIGAGGSVRLLAQHGEGLFADETAARGFEGLTGVEHALAGDVDGDGSVELVLGGSGGLRILESVGGAFVDATESAGLDRSVASTALAWVDADQDGVLDLHVATLAGAHRVFGGLGDGSFVELDLGLAAMDDAPNGTAVVVTGGGSAAPGSLPTDAGTIEAPADRPRSIPRGSRGGPTAAVSGGPDVVGVGSGPEFGTTQSMLVCTPHLEDQATSGCLSASSTPTLGMLYPISNELYVDAATGYVGIGTTTPAYSLHVAGQIVSGTGNSATGPDSALGGGVSNFVSGSLSTIAGGGHNQMTGNYSVIGGGGGAVSTDRNLVDSDWSVVAGGRDNRIFEPIIAPTASASGSTISGGKSNEITCFEDTLSLNHDAQWCSIGGGLQNGITGAEECTIGGGKANEIIELFGSPARAGTIAGGRENLIEGCAHVTIGGGFNNEVLDGNYATIGGGAGNEVLYDGNSATIGGGNSNGVSGRYAVVAGGAQNQAGGEGGAVPGGQLNVADGDMSFAAGFRANALHDGTFVWADDTFADFSSTADDQFLIRASGGVGIGNDSPAAALDVVGDNEALRAVATSASGIGLNVNGGTAGIGVLASGGDYAGYFLNEVLVTGGSDVDLSGGSYFQCGDDGGQNVAIDTNEIMARNNGGIADLSLNINGGNVEMIATGTGRVGIGTNDPSAKLEVFGDSSADVFRVRVDGTTRLVLDGNGGLAVGSNLTPSYDLEISSGAPNGGTAAKPGGGSWSNSSDRRLKKNIEDLDGALETLLALRGVTYEYIDPDAIGELHGTRIGFVAQEVEEVLPDWVGEKPDGMKMLTIRGFEALAVEALRELDDENGRLRERLERRDEAVDRLEGELAKLGQDNDRLRARLAERDDTVRAELEELRTLVRAIGGTDH